MTIKQREKKLEALYNKRICVPYEILITLLEALDHIGATRELSAKEKKDEYDNYVGNAYLDIRYYTDKLREILRKEWEKRFLMEESFHLSPIKRDKSTDIVLI